MGRPLRGLLARSARSHHARRVRGAARQEVLPPADRAEVHIPQDVVGPLRGPGAQRPASQPAPTRRDVPPRETGTHLPSTHQPAAHQHDTHQPDTHRHETHQPDTHQPATTSPNPVGGRQTSVIPRQCRRFGRCQGDRRDAGDGAGEGGDDRPLGFVGEVAPDGRLSGGHVDLPVAAAAGVAVE